MVDPLQVFGLSLSNTACHGHSFGTDSLPETIFWEPPEPLVPHDVSKNLQFAQQQHYHKPIFQKETCYWDWVINQRRITIAILPSPSNVTSAGIDFNPGRVHHTRAILTKMTYTVRIWTFSQIETHNKNYQIKFV